MSEHIVYRLYRQDVLIYIGYSSALGSRFAAHARTASWWPEVDAITLQRFDTRKAALDHEREAILREKPARNTARYPTVGGKTPLRSFRIPDDLYADAQARAKAEGRSLTEVLREALIDYIDGE